MKKYIPIYEEDGSIDLASTKDILRKGKILEYKGWSLTAKKKFPQSKDNRILITAKKAEMTDVDDTLSYLLQRIDAGE